MTDEERNVLVEQSMEKNKKRLCYEKSLRSTKKTI